MNRYSLLQRMGLARLPVSTDAERKVRRQMFTLVGVLLVLGAIMVIGFGVFHQRWVFAFVPVVWLCAMGVAFLATRIANANYDGKKHLERVGYKVCPACEYDLSELPDAGTCPECGGEYEPAMLKERWRDIYTKLEEKVGR